MRPIENTLKLMPLFLSSCLRNIMAIGMTMNSPLNLNADANAADSIDK